MQVEPADAIFHQFARIADALSSPSRLKLMDRLCQGEQTVEHLAEAAGLSVSNASRQLRILAECRLAEVGRDPPRVYYRVAGERVVRFWFSLRELAPGATLRARPHHGRSRWLGRDSLLPISRDGTPGEDADRRSRRCRCPSRSGIPGGAHPRFALDPGRTARSAAGDHPVRKASRGLLSRGRTACFLWTP